MKFFVFIAFILLVAVDVHAQESLIQKKKEIHVSVGPAYYSGDLGDGLHSASMMVNVGLSFNKDKKLNGNVKIMFGSVSGQELDYATDDGTGVPATPNAFFKSPIIGFNFEAHYHIIHKEKFKLFLSQGIGIVRFDPKDLNGNSLLDLPDTRPLGESYRNIAIQLPTQLGFKYYLPNHFAFGMQAGFVNPMTDFLDNLGVWGNKNGNDNIFTLQFQLHIPLY